MTAVIAGLIAAICCILAYRTGLRDGRAVKEGKDPAPLTLPERRKKANKNIEIERQRLEKIMQNIEAYDGSTRGQKKI